MTNICLLCQAGNSSAKTMNPG